MTSYWAVAQTVSTMEYIVRREIEKTNHGAFVPTYARHAVVDGRRTTKEHPRFVGYVFFHTSGEDYAGISDIHGVYGVLSTATGKASEVTAEEMHRMTISHATGDAETLPVRYTKYYRPLAYISVRRKNSRKPRPGKRIRNCSAA
jgi:transcription antitermination factor NusG